LHTAVKCLQNQIIKKGALSQIILKPEKEREKEGRRGEII